MKKSDSFAFKLNDEGEKNRAYSSTSEFIKNLPTEIDYAIERGLSDIDNSLVSDLDIVITKVSFKKLYGIALQRNMVVSATPTFGGVRLFIALSDGGIKRIDCMWSCAYLGLPICDVSRLLDARCIDDEAGLYVLDLSTQAEVIFAVKNAYGGAEKYRTLLEQHGMSVLDSNARFRWLILKFINHPLMAFTGLVRLILSYTARMILPSGLKIYGMTVSQLRDSPLLCYLFQNRISAAGFVDGFIRSRFSSELCVVASRKSADVDLGNVENLEFAEQAILTCLRRHRTRLPFSVMAIS